MSARYAAFDGRRLLALGSRSEVALAIRRASEGGATGPLLAFDPETGDAIDVDPRAAEIREDPPRGPGRPKLGVVAREVTLLPRHWEWLAAQSGGASVALRRLVEEARRADGGATRARRTRDAAYRFLSTMAGDLPGFEEASRALFAGRREDFAARLAAWPPDIARYAEALLSEADDSAVVTKLNSPP